MPVTKTIPIDDTADDLPFLLGGGVMAELIRHHAWSATPLGPIEAWPEALKAAVRIMLRTPVPVVILWGPSGVMIYNDGYTEFAADRHPEQLGMGVRNGWAEVADFNDHVMNVCLSGGTLSYQDQELTLYRNGRVQQVWMNLDYSPIPDETGEPVGVMAIVVETTARVLADRWKAKEQDRLQRLFEQAPSFMAMLRGETHIFEMVNPGYMRLIGHRDIQERPVAEALPEVATQGYVDMLDTAFRSGEAVTGLSQPIMLERHKGEAPEQRYVDFVYQPIRDDRNVVTHIFVQGSDVTERVVGERQQKLLMHELSHRVKNTLAVVQSIATRTLRGADSLKEAEMTLGARIIALSRAQDIVTRQSGEGAAIGDVVVTAVQSRNDDPQRFRIDGPDIKLTSGAALALSLALHELWTNATKYGALSADAGRVSIDWTIVKQDGDAVLRFVWEESGGPVVAQPSRKGFGSTLIKDAVAAETDGTADLDYRPAGVIFTLQAPLKSIRAA